MSVLEYWLWLSGAQGVSTLAKARLLSYYNDAEAVFFAPAGELRVAGISAGEAAVLEKRDLRRAGEILEQCGRQGVSILTMCDAAYPRRLRNIPQPPAVLYVKGRLPQLDDEAAIAVIGTRKASEYGLRMGRNIACELAGCGAVVVSGLTSGVDAAAAAGALSAGGVCIGVLGTPIEAETGALAARVAERGALISEHPPGTPQLKSFFRDRNRIAAGISLGVVVVEAPEKSGARLFAAEAAEQGKEIFALPGNADDPNCAGSNALLKEGAKPVTKGVEVLEDFVRLFPKKLDISKTAAPPAGMEACSSKGNIPLPDKKVIDKEKARGYIDLKEQLSQLSEEQLKIISAIGGDSSHVDDIITATGLSTATVLAQLTILEIKGYVRREAGRRIALNTVKN